MKRTILAGAAALLPALVGAHPHHDILPSGPPLTVAVDTGSGKFHYRNVLGWGALPDGLGMTNGSIAVDKAGLVYVSTDGPNGILVYDAAGSLQRKIPLTKVHGLIIHEDAGKEFLWASHGAGKRLVKLTLAGEEVLAIPNDKTGEVQGGFKGITAAAIAPDGSIYIAVGYGSNFIHQFDAEGRHLKTFAGKGKGDGQCNTCHGLALDTRFDPPRLLVADRESNRVTHFGLDGGWIGVHATDLRRPTDLSFRGDTVAVAELGGRLTLLGKDGKVEAHLGDNPNEKQRANAGVKPADVPPGIFSAPHGVAFDAAGNLYVQDWNRTGRVTKLEHVATGKDPQ